MKNELNGSYFLAFVILFMPNIVFSDYKYWTIGPSVAFRIGDEFDFGIGLESSWYFTVGDDFLIGPNIGVEILVSQGLNVYSQFQVSQASFGMSVGPNVIFPSMNTSKLGGQIDVWAPFVFRRIRAIGKTDEVYWGGYYRYLKCTGYCSEGVPSWD